MKSILALGLVLISSGCDRDGSAKAYLRWDDRLVARLPIAGLVLGFPCERSTKHRGQTVRVMLPTDQCFRMTPRRRMSGIWIDEFEGSQFCPTGRACPPDHRPRIWLDWMEGGFPAAYRRGDMDRPSRYAIEFVGRRTLYAGHYGHFGMFDHAVIVDQMISIKPLPDPSAAKN